MAKCNRCPADVWWARTEASDKPMPLNMHPTDDGNCIVVSQPGARTAIVRVLKKGEDPPDEVNRYTSHFATCPGRKR